MKGDIIFCFFSLIFFFKKTLNLICPPDHFMPKDNYWDELDFIDANEKYYGFAFSYILNENYNDHWYGIIYKKNQFCIYDDNSNFVSNIKPTTTSYEPISGEYILINKSETNYFNMYKYRCTYEYINIAMDEYITDTLNDFYLYFRVVNVFDFDLSFKFELIGQNKNSEETTAPITEPYTIKAHSTMLVKIQFKLGSNEGNDQFKIETPTISPDDMYYFRKGNNLRNNHKMLIRLVNTGPNGNVGLVTYQMMYRRPNNTILTYLGSTNCSNNEECIEGHFCNSSKKCQKCYDYSCKKCAGPNANDKCNQCFQISPNWIENNVAGCDLDYVDFTKFEIQFTNDTQIGQVPPAIHWKVTMDLWFYINYPLNIKKHLDVIYTDFMTISFDKTNQEDALDIFCIPIEWLYNFTLSDNYSLSASEYINDILGAFHLKDNVKNAANKWLYIRCAFDIYTSKMYLNEMPEQSLKIPQLYTISAKEQNNFPFHMKKFYEYDDFLRLKFKNFLNVTNIQETFIYLRNLNLFKEYIPQHIQTKYWTFPDLLILNKYFPQLLFSIPFKAKYVSRGNYTFSTYNYYPRRENGEVSDDYFISEKNTLKLVSSFSTIESIFQNLHPPRNFQRLNFLPYTTDKTQEYSTCDLENTVDIPCNKEGSKFCFDNDKPFLCLTNETNTDYPYMLDINTLECNKFCPIGYMHPPRDANNGYLNGLYCSVKCPNESSKCPSEQSVYMKTNSEFTCDNQNFYELYYNCLKSNSSINNETGGMFFSGTLKSKTIILNLTHEYESYAISAWIYADKRLRRSIMPNNTVDYTSKTNFTNHTVFLMNGFQVNVGSTQVLDNGTKISWTRPHTDEFDMLNWNHFFFSWEKKYSNQGYRFHVTFQNQIYKSEATNESNIYRPLTKIVFCHLDKTNFSHINFGNICNTTKWLDAFYRNIKIYDILQSNRYAAFMAEHYELGKNILFKHQYMNKLESIRKNNFTDEYGDGQGYVYNMNFNPDNINYINYAANYALEHAFPTTETSTSFVVLNYTIKKQMADLIVQSGSSRCKIATTNDSCLSCIDGYSLLGNKCMRQENDDYSQIGDAITDFPAGTTEEEKREQQMKAYYYYKNPIGKKMPKHMKLNLNLDSLKNAKYLTIFWFIKLYGRALPDNSAEYDFWEVNIPDTQVEIISFNTEEILYLGFDFENNRDSYFISQNRRRIFEPVDLRDTNRLIGHWVPMSLAVFREYDRTFTLNMDQFCVNYFNVHYLFGRCTNFSFFFPRIHITEFSISRQWVGLMSDIRVYDQFFSNAWGIVKMRGFDTVSDSPLLNVMLKSKRKDRCVSEYDFETQLPEGEKFECVNDYNPHWVQCAKREANYVGWKQNWDGSACGSSCGTSEYVPVHCLGGGGNIDTRSCDNRATYYKNYELIYKIDQGVHAHNDPNCPDGVKVQCKEQKYIDYARYKNITMKNIKSPGKQWAIDFWTYQQNFLNVWDSLSRDNDTEGNRSDWETNNFKNFVLEWDYHIRFTLEAVFVKLDNEYTYNIKCKPISVKDDPSLSSPTEQVMDIGDVRQKWKFLTCGVSLGDHLMFESDTTSKSGREITFESHYEEVPSIKNVTFTINENSPNGYGIVHIKELRLWECYDCTLGKRNFEYVEGDILFMNCLHCFKGDNNYLNSTYPIFEDSVNPENKIELYSVADFNGYNLLKDYGIYITCDETYFEYLKVTGEQECIIDYNLNRANDFNATTYSSRTGRYTMEFWFYIETISQMSNGVNFIWENHLSMTLITSNTQSTVINIICLPQAYLDKVEGKASAEVYNTYNKALNKDIFEFYNIDNTWQYVRCAVDHTRKVFRISSYEDYTVSDEDKANGVKYQYANNEKELEPEILHGNTRTVRPFRFFDIKKTSYVKFEHFNINYSRQYMKQFKLFREYIDFRIEDIKSINWWTNTNLYNFWLLTFIIDFDVVTYSSSHDYTKYNCRNSNNCGMYYRYYDREDSSNYKTGYIRTIFINNPDTIYTTYPPIYNLQLCSPGQTRPYPNKYNSYLYNKCTGNGYYSYPYYRATNKYFYPNPSNNLLNLDTLTYSNTCPVNSCKNPDNDNYDLKGYCLITPNSTNHIKSCDRGYSQTTFYDNFQCEDGYQRVYYECIDNKLVKGSAMYFSNFYSFPNLIFIPNDIDYASNTDYNLITNSLGKKVIDPSDMRLTSYFLEFWFKLDYFNDPIVGEEEQYFFYGYPHSILRQSSDNIFYYSNQLITGGSLHYPLPTIHSYEWNRIIIDNRLLGESEQFKITVYVNYEFSVPPVEILIEISRAKMHFRGIAFCNKDNLPCRINNQNIYIHWGIAWYKNIRVWNGAITSLPLIQACEFGYTEIIKSMKFYFPLTVDFIEKNTVKGKIASYKFEHLFWYYNRQYDYDFRQNYSGEEMDYSGMNINTFISGTNEAGNDYQLTECDETCKRCYSIGPNACYECRTGYILYERRCKKATGFYFKIPSQNTTFDRIQLKTETPYFSLKTTNPITITFWMKFFGVEYNKFTGTKKYYPIIYLFEELTFLAFNAQENFLSFVIQNNNITSQKEAFDIEIAEIMGTWVHIGLSSHISDTETRRSYFPHMFNFMLNKKVLTQLPIFNPLEDPVFFNTFTFDPSVVAYFSNLRIYNNFWFATMGHVTAIQQTISIDLVYEIDLNSNTKENCVSDSDLGYSNLMSVLLPICVNDYLPYEDFNLKCNSDDYYLDISKIDITEPCTLCDSYCTLNCYGISSSQCTCNYRDGLYWVKTNNELSEYECQEVNNINFAFYEKLQLENMQSSKNDEAMISFWFNIYQYIPLKFKSLEIIWDQHIRVEIKGEQPNNAILVTCFPDYDIEGSIIPLEFKENSNFFYGKWYYINCGADKYRNIYKIK